MMLDGWTVEINYQATEFTDPMQDYLNEHAEQIFKVPDSVDDFLNPPPDVHFVYLMMHMSINHFCSRYIWFVDLVMLVRKQGSLIDMNTISTHLKSVGILNVGSGICAFCQRYITHDFPAIDGGKLVWNNRFHRGLLNPLTVITRMHTLKHRNALSYFFGYCEITAVFFLIGDCEGNLFSFKSLEAKRSSARFMYGMNWKGSFLRGITEACSALLLIPIGFMVSWASSLRYVFQGLYNNEN
jgi:hypothetical protein